MKLPEYILEIIQKINGIGYESAERDGGGSSRQRSDL